MPIPDAFPEPEGPFHAVVAPSQAAQRALPPTFPAAILDT